MFDLAARSIVWIPMKWKAVEQRNPDDIAEETEFEIEVQVDLLPTNEMAEVWPRSEELPEDAPEEEKVAQEKALKLTNFDRFKRVVLGWRRVKSGGQDAPFTDENIKALLARALVVQAFEVAYLQALSGRVERAEKNSASSFASGQPGAGGQNQTQGKRKRRGS